MQILNLPFYEAQISESNGKRLIYDVLRRKNVALTPEEWVRQSFINYLVSVKSYPPARIANEVGITVNSTSKRCDTVVYDDFLNPLVIAEYKAPDINITSEVFNQITRYNFALKVPYLIVSNGLAHYCCSIDYDTMKYVFIPEIPDYKDIKNAKL